MTALLLPLLTSAMLLAAPDLVEAPEAVQSGQKALDHWGRYPWYDAKTDGLQPLDVSPPGQDNWFTSRGGSGVDHLPDNLLQWIAWILIGLILVALLYVAARTYRARQQEALGEATTSASAEDPAEERRRVEALPLPAARRQVDLLAEAEEQYRSGHYGQAIIYLFSYQLVQLDRHQQIHLTRGKTNRQYLRELGVRPALRKLLEQTMVTFEDAFFGHHPIDQNRFEACWCRLREFESLTAEARG